MGKPRKRAAKVTKLKKGEHLRIDITLPKSGVVVIKVPDGGTVSLEKSIPVLQATADLT